MKRRAQRSHARSPACSGTAVALRRPLCLRARPPWTALLLLLLWGCCGGPRPWFAVPSVKVASLVGWRRPPVDDGDAYLRHAASLGCRGRAVTRPPAGAVVARACQGGRLQSSEARMQGGPTLPPLLALGAAHHGRCCCRCCCR